MEQSVTEKKFFNNNIFHQPPGSLKEQQLFAEIQTGFANQFEHFFPDKLASKTIVIIPSLTLDQQAVETSPDVRVELVEAPGGVAGAEVLAPPPEDRVETADDDP